MLRTYTIRLRPTKRQSADLARVLAISCELYNAALQERRDAWKIARKSINYYDQQAELTQLRVVDEDTAWLAVDIAREPLRRVDRAFKAFWRRCKTGARPGFPRWRSSDRYDSFATYKSKIEGDLLLLPRLGGFRFRSHREICGRILHSTVIRGGQKWTARVTCDIGPAPAKVAVSNPVGIDLGLENFIYCSDGNFVGNPRWVASSANQIAKGQRSLGAKKRGSNNRARAVASLARYYAKIRNCRANFTHHVSKQLVTDYDLIAFEKLNVAGMVRGHFAKSILDAAWGQLLLQIAYKAENAGRYAIAVNPRGTSQKCSHCGAIKKKELAERRHACACGASLHRDHNAALNVLALGQRAVDSLAEAQ